MPHLAELGNDVSEFINFLNEQSLSAKKQTQQAINHS